MKVNLRELRQAGKLQIVDIARKVGRSRAKVSEYEKRGEISSTIYKKYHNAFPRVFPLPDDFECYNAHVLVVLYEQQKEDYSEQKWIELLGFSSQGMWNRYKKENKTFKYAPEVNRYFYEYKEQIQKIYKKFHFDPWKVVDLYVEKKPKEPWLEKVEEPEKKIIFD